MLEWLFGGPGPKPILSDELADGHYCVWCGAQHHVKSDARRYFDPRTGSQAAWEPWQTGCPNGHGSRYPDSSGL